MRTLSRHCAACAGRGCAGVAVRERAVTRRSDPGARSDTSSLRHEDAPWDTRTRAGTRGYARGTGGNREAHCDERARRLQFTKCCLGLECKVHTEHCPDVPPPLVHGFTTPTSLPAPRGCRLRLDGGRIRLCRGGLVGVGGVTEHEKSASAAHPDPMSCDRLTMSWRDVTARGVCR